MRLINKRVGQISNGQKNRDQNETNKNKCPAMTTMLYGKNSSFGAQKTQVQIVGPPSIVCVTLGLF